MKTKPWTVQDVLDLSPSDTLLLPADQEAILHELGCRFAEAVLLAERIMGREPDARSWAAIKAKRAWLRGEIDDAALEAARVAAQEVK